MTASLAIWSWLGQVQGFTRTQLELAEVSLGSKQQYFPQRSISNLLGSGEATEVTEDVAEDIIQ